VRAARKARRRGSAIALGLAVGLIATGALAQSLDLGGTAQTSSDRPNPTARQRPPPVPGPPPVVVPPLFPGLAGQGDNVRAGLTPLAPLTGRGAPGNDSDAAKSPPDAPTDGQPAETATNAPEPEPISLDNPSVLDTAKLAAGDTTVALFGIIGLPGEAAAGLQSFIAAAGPKVTCQQQANAEFVCLTADGTDVAMISLVNGASQTRLDSPDVYREQEAAAQAARRGIWANLPAPPVQVSHPSVRDTATLLADGRLYRLDGVDGMGGSYARDLQGYIATHDDNLMCQPQSTPDHFICVLTDGTDIAKVALVNGAAKVAADAPDSYRIQQGEAVNNRRGIWATVTLAAMQSMPAIIPGPEAYPTVVGDEADGVAYVGGVPSAVIDGETVFLAYGGVAGWGYYDHWHHWRGAPERFRAHMEHFHPGGAGLRGYRYAGGPGGGFREPHPGGPGGAAHFAGAGPGGGAAHFAGAGPGGGAHFGGAPGAPHFNGGFVHPGGMPAGGFHPGGVGGFHPGGGGGGGGFHPSGGGAGGGGGGHHR